MTDIASELINEVIEEKKPVKKTSKTRSRSRKPKITRPDRSHLPKGGFLWVRNEQIEDFKKSGYQVGDDNSKLIEIFGTEAYLILNLTSRYKDITLVPLDGDQNNSVVI